MTDTLHVAVLKCQRDHKERRDPYAEPSVLIARTPEALDAKVAEYIRGLVGEEQLAELETVEDEDDSGQPINRSEKMSNAKLIAAFVEDDLGGGHDWEYHRTEAELS